jgi:hypothetical protein
LHRCDSLFIVTVEIPCGLEKFLRNRKACQIFLQSNNEFVTANICCAGDWINQSAELTSPLEGSQEGFNHTMGEADILWIAGPPPI